MVLAQTHVAIILGPHVLAVLELFQIACDLLELEVCLVVVKWDDRDTIFGLEAVAVGGLR